MPVKEFMFKKAAGWRPATKMNSFTGIFWGFCQLYKNAYFQEQLWTAASEFLLKGISEHPVIVISFITYFHTLKPWNEINEDRILMDK